MSDIDMGNVVEAEAPEGSREEKVEDMRRQETENETKQPSTSADATSSYELIQEGQKTGDRGGEEEGLQPVPEGSSNPQNLIGVKGRVEWYNVWKRYGFIKREGAERADIFVHQRDIANSRCNNPRYRTLSDGENVVFTLVYGEDGKLKATNVTGPDGARVKGYYFFEMFIRMNFCRSQYQRFLGTQGASARGTTRSGRQRHPGPQGRQQNTSSAGVASNAGASKQPQNQVMQASVPNQPAYFGQVPPNLVPAGVGLNPIPISMNINGVVFNSVLLPQINVQPAAAYGYN